VQQGGRNGNRSSHATAHRHHNEDEDEDDEEDNENDGEGRSNEGNVRKMNIALWHALWFERDNATQHTRAMQRCETFLDSYARYFDTLAAGALVMVMVMW
jgi:hypothetical protein